MAQVNRCLKQLFFGFNMLLGIAGCVLLVLGTTAAPHDKELDQGESTGLAWIVSTAVVSVLLSLLGACGAYKENIALLKVFVGIMGFGIIVFLIVGFNVARSMPEAKCCGIMSYRDWDSKIPETCKCSTFKSDPSQCMEVQTTKDDGIW
ncbi:unnamed protein product, partial [Coregonus sp. 'balchen']